MNNDVEMPDIDRVSRLRHDVMNPLTVVLCYAKLLAERGDLSQQAHEYCLQIITQAEKCVEIFELDKAAHAAPAQAARQSVAMEPRGADEPVAVLVVEDDDGIRALVCEVLQTGLGEKFGAVDVGCTPNRARALELIAGRRYDVIVVDLNVDTSGGGLELLSSIEAVQPGAVGRAMMISGGVMDQVTQRVLDRMSIPLLKKPFAIADLVDCALNIVVQQQCVVK
jgi:CheY-like chemotaxis protein